MRWEKRPKSSGDWGTRMQEGKGEEYCLEFGQVLLQHVTHLEGQGPQEEWVPGLPVTASAWS